MPKKVTPDQRHAILGMLAQGQDRDTIAAAVGVTAGQVSAISAHVKMGTYILPEAEKEKQSETSMALERATNLLRQLQKTEGAREREAQVEPVLIGVDIETGEEVFWNPDQATGTPNPHALILGESGTGKTYSISCLTAELARQGVVSVVFDYGQGFSPKSLPREFVAATNPIEVQVGRDGVDVNPLQLFPNDLHGPVNVAQRVADTFARVYKKIGVQQHAILRQAVLDVMADAGIRPDAPNAWSADLPAFGSIQNKLADMASQPQSPQARFAASAGSHVSTLFVFNTFRPGGRKLAWDEMLGSPNRVVVIQLRGLEHSLERAVTEFLLWNLIGFIESMGPGPLRCFVILDEAHKLSFDRGSPVEKLLREGRKFGLGLILASQQPEDFSPVAFANTATNRKIKNAHSFGEIYQLITKLPRGCAYVVTENIGRVVRVANFHDRAARWRK
jgi:hypothetical protein